METPSLQSLITQYGAKYGISIPAKPATAATPPAPSATPDPGTPSGRTTDHVTLSPQALEYQKAHTLPTGTFQKPNLFGDFLGALDTSSDASGNGNADDSSPASLLDILNSKAADGSSAQNPATPGNPAKPFDTLTSFLN